eukprot:5438251-Prymnesium_polylepis.1
MVLLQLASLRPADAKARRGGPVKADLVACPVFRGYKLPYLAGAEEEEEHAGQVCPPRDRLSDPRRPSCRPGNDCAAADPNRLRRPSPSLNPSPSALTLQPAPLRLTSRILTLDPHPTPTPPTLSWPPVSSPVNAARLSHLGCAGARRGQGRGGSGDSRRGCGAATGGGRGGEVERAPPPPPREGREAKPGSRGTRRGDGGGGARRSLPLEQIVPAVRPRLV